MYDAVIRLSLEKDVCLDAFAHIFSQPSSGVYASMTEVAGPDRCGLWLRYKKVLYGLIGIKSIKNVNGSVTRMVPLIREADWRSGDRRWMLVLLIRSSSCIQRFSIVLSFLCLWI
jgi:hypothetical protein